MHDTRTNITILAWPSGMGRPQARAVLVEALGLDPYIADLRVAKPPPLVVARVDDSIAASVGAVLKTHGVPFLNLTDAEMDAAAKPLLAKRLEFAPDAPEPMYMVEPWRGETMGLRMADVYCIVRAKIKRARVGPAIIDSTPRRDPLTGVSWSVDVSVKHERSTSMTNVIDLWLLDREHPVHLQDGRIFPGQKRIRINSEKFSWDVLGSERAHGATESADRLALRLADQAPQAAVELGFLAFRESSAAAIGSGWSATLQGGSRTDHHPAFEFYSAWCGLLHWRARCVGGAGSSPTEPPR